MPCSLTKSYKTHEEYVRLEIIRFSDATGFQPKKNYETRRKILRNGKYIIKGQYLTSCAELLDRAEHLRDVQLSDIGINDLEDVLERLDCAIVLRWKVDAKYDFKTPKSYEGRCKVLDQVCQFLKDALWNSQLAA